MKRILAAIICAVMTMSVLSGCAYKDALDNAEPQATTVAGNTNTEEENKVDYKKFDNSLDGLCKYMSELGYFEYKDDKSYMEMDAELVGAKSGRRFVNGNVFIELYEFEKQDSEAYKSVKENGSFVILNLPEVKATLSDNGKYMLVYTDKAIDKNNPDKESNEYKNMQKAIEQFKAFYK